MASTIHDIAKKTGVSPSTVSRVLNGKGVISELTSEKILSAAKELQYHPNSLAKRLANGRAQAIALIIDATDHKSFANQFFNRSVFGIENALQKSGYNLIITSDDQKLFTSVDDILLSKKADGLIIPSSLISSKLASKLFQKQFPFVVLGEPTCDKNKINWVDINNAQGSELAVDHLVKKNYQNIAFIGKKSGQVFTQNRIDGFVNRLSELSIPVSDNQIPNWDESPESYEQNIAEFIEKNPNLDAFLCNDNEIAFLVLKYVKQLGKRVPHDAGIISFDNFPLAQYMEPPLTTIDIDTFMLGEQAALMLLRAIETNSYSQQTLINTQLFERESTLR